MHSTSEQRPSTSTTASNAYPAPFASSRKSVTWPQPSSHDHAPPTEDRPSTDPGCGTTGRRLGPGDNRAKCKQERMFRSSSQLVASGGLNWQILASIATTGGAGTRPEVSGLPRLTSAVCGEYARKLLWARRLRWSQACSLGTVNPSRKLRRFESFTCHHVRERASDLRKRGSEALLIYLVGVSKRPVFGYQLVLGSQPLP